MYSGFEVVSFPRLVLCFAINLRSQLKRLNTEIETLGANLTDVMQKENDTANQVSLGFLVVLQLHAIGKKRGKSHVNRARIGRIENIGC